LYYLIFFALAFVTRPELSAQPVSLFNWQLPDLMLPILTAWLGASVAIALVFLFGRAQEVADSQNQWLPFLLGGIVVDIVCNFAAMKLMRDAGENAAQGVLPLALVATANLGILIAATSAGLLVAKGLKEPRYLVMAAIVGAVTDIFSVYAGPSKQVLSSDVFPYVGYQWGVWSQGVIPCVGAGDFIFLSLYFAGARRFDLSERKTFLAMIAAFGLGFLSLAFTSSGIPALPFMATLLLLVHARELKRQMHKASNP